MLKSTFALSETATLQLEGPDGSPVGFHDPTALDEDGKPVFHRMSIELLRAASPEAEKFKNRKKNERLRKAAHSGKLNLTQEELDAEALDLAVFCTRGWSNFVGEDDKPLKFTAENVRALYSDRRFVWLYQQVDSFIANAASFAGN